MKITSQKMFLSILSVSGLLFFGSFAKADLTSQIVTQDTSTVNNDDGFQVIDVTVGEGVTATAGQEVIVHYTGWLYEPTATNLRGVKFDSSVDRDQPFNFRLGTGSVIDGWDLGVEGMKVGGERTLIIPPEKAYGDRAIGQFIPANATLIFDVELLDAEIGPAETCVAFDDSGVTQQNTIFTTSSVLTNDTDVDGDTLIVLSVDSESLNGVTLLNNDDGTFTYTPGIDFSGVDTFNYTVTDNNGCVDEATFTITVIADPVTIPEVIVETGTDTEVLVNSDGEVSEESVSGSGGSLNVLGIFTLIALFVSRRKYRSIKINRRKYI